MGLKEIVNKAILLTVAGSVGSERIVRNSGLSTDINEWSGFQRVMYAFASPLVVSSAISVYLISSLSVGAPMFSDAWYSRIDESIRQERLVQEQRYRTEFKELDKNGDGVVDSLEFIYRKD